jgi:hypothetical protein
MQDNKRQKTLITRVPPSLAEEIEKRAQRELMPVAAYVRRLLLKATSNEAGPRAAAEG